MTISRLIQATVVTAKLLLVLTLWLALDSSNLPAENKTILQRLADNWPVILIALVSSLNIFLALYLIKKYTKTTQQLAVLLSKYWQNKKVEPPLIEALETNNLEELITITAKYINKDIIATQDNQKLQTIVFEKTASLIKAEEELSQFAYRASHDLKSPLSSSKSLSQLIINDIEAGDIVEAKLNTQKIYQQINKLDNLVSDIIDVAKADLVHEQKEEIDFSALIKEVKESISWLMRDSGCDIICDIDLQEAVYSEKSRLFQVIENLVTNAIKYRDNKKSNCYVKILAYHEASNLIIVVKDNGIGIPKEKHADVFKLFKRFHPDRSFGSGLGMSIIYKQVKNLGGRIDFQSSSKGTIFNIKILATHVKKP